MVAPFVDVEAVMRLGCMFTPISLDQVDARGILEDRSENGRNMIVVFNRG